MMYLAQIAAVLYVTWASIYYQWGTSGYAVSVVAFFAALLVTAIIIEIKLLPLRFARLRTRLVGLKDEPADEIPCLPRPARHSRYSLQDGRRLRIGKDPG